MPRLHRTANLNPLPAPLHRAFVPSAFPNQGVQRKQKRGPLAIAAAKCVFYRSLPRSDPAEPARASLRKTGDDAMQRSHHCRLRSLER